MLIIKRKKGEDMDKMLKRYKSKVKRTKLIEEVRGRTNYTKKSVKKRKLLNKGKWIQSIVSSME
jgi:small subunit ribosomal protein S21